jgi:hypothetical protein
MDPSCSRSTQPTDNVALVAGGSPGYDGAIVAPALPVPRESEAAEETSSPAKHPQGGLSYSAAAAATPVRGPLEVA